MLAHFLIFARCFFAHRYVQRLTDGNFDSTVNSQDPNSTFLVMFHGEHCPACKSTYPDFIKAATALRGIARLGHVDCGRERQLSTRFRIYSIPQFRLFHDRKVSSVATFIHTESNFISSVVDRVGADPAVVNQSWVEAGNSAVLVTSRWRTPWQWKAIAANFSATNVRIGIANNRHNRPLFNTTDQDSVHFLSRGRITPYRGALSFLELQAAIEKHFQGVIDPPEKREASEGGDL
jgi:protein disulfide-isomerase A6